MKSKPHFHRRGGRWTYDSDWEFTGEEQDPDWEAACRCMDFLAYLDTGDRKFLQPGWDDEPDRDA